MKIKLFGVLGIFYYAKWALFCNASGIIPISSLPAHVLAEVAKGSGSLAL
jgi:hypothetical protein